MKTLLVEEFMLSWTVQSAYKVHEGRQSYFTGLINN